jgi:hypothetical protein
MIEFALPILGSGDGQPSPTTVKWADGTLIYRGILGGFDPGPEQELPSTNVISFAEYLEKKRWESASRSNPDDSGPAAA